MMYHKKIGIMAILCVAISTFLFSQDNGSGVEEPKVILITFDGLRWQELFGGADVRLIGNPKFVDDTASLIKEFWADTPEERRNKVFPFFWEEIKSNGQLYGNRELDNMVNLTNNMWFSYPGYNEILSGFADDERINSNDKINNPNVTVLEFLEKKPEFENKVAAFGSWEVFNYIINEQRSGIPVNAGYEQVADPINVEERLINQLQNQIPKLSESGRWDAFTFHLALSHLLHKQPRLLFISFEETDHFAHAGDYTQYLNSARQTDRFIRELWETVQANPFYKNQTTMIITTDHGRGPDPEGWQHHGKTSAPHSDETWLAVIGPGITPKGEVQTPAQIYTNQIAATISRILGYEYPVEKAGEDLMQEFYD